MSNENTITKEQFDEVLDKLENGNYKLYFFCPDFDKHSGGVGLLYDHVRILNENGFNAVVLHNKKGFKPSWLGKRAEGVPIEYMENNTLSLNLEDFFFIPEGFPNVMEMLRQQNVPAKKIVFCQNWYYILNALQPGQTWQQLGIGDCLSVSEFQTRYIQSIFPGIRCKNVVGSVDNEVFKKPDSMTTKLPQVAFLPSRDGGLKSANVIKTFYLLFPHFKWIQFKQLTGLETEEFAAAMRESAFYVHFDEFSSWGTAPIEAWLSGCYVAGWDGVGGVEYMRPVNLREPDKNTGNIWLAPNGDIVKLALLIGNMIESWVTNEMPKGVNEAAEIACENYTKEAERDSVLTAHKEYCEERIAEIQKLRDKFIAQNEVVTNEQ